MARLLQNELLAQAAASSNYTNPWHAYLSSRYRLRPWTVGSGRTNHFATNLPTNDFSALQVQARRRNGSSTSSYLDAIADAEAAAWTEYEWFRFGTITPVYGHCNVGGRYELGGVPTPPESGGTWVTKSWDVTLGSFRVRFPVPYQTGKLRVRYGIRVCDGYTTPTGEGSVTEPNFTDVIIEPTWLNSASEGANSADYRVGPYDSLSGAAAFSKHRMTPENVTRSQLLSTLNDTGLELTVTATPVRVVGIRVFPADVPGVSPYIRSSPATIAITPATGDDTGGGATAEFKQAPDGYYYPVVTAPGSGWKKLPKLSIGGVDMGASGSGRLAMEGGAVESVTFVSYTPTIYFYSGRRLWDCVRVNTDWTNIGVGYFWVRGVVGTETFYDFEWDGVVPSGYDYEDPDTWPTSDWIDLPNPGAGEVVAGLMPACDLDW